MNNMVNNITIITIHHSSRTMHHHPHHHQSHDHHATCIMHHPFSIIIIITIISSNTSSINIMIVINSSISIRISIFAWPSSSSLFESFPLSEKTFGADIDMPGSARTADGKVSLTLHPEPHLVQNLSCEFRYQLFCSGSFWYMTMFFPSFSR